MKTFATTIAALAAIAVVGFASPSLALTPINILPQAVASAPKFIPVGPQVKATVSLKDQRMDLIVVTGQGETLGFTWKVSTGRKGFDTPVGSFQPTWMSEFHRSKTYDNAPMPHAVFFTGGYAVHATDYVGNLGRRASHGCVRLSPENAALFYSLVASYGKANTQIVITD
jgi:lipoprotein-anchoring transpeptidase ErfK/SrfK